VVFYDVLIFVGLCELLAFTINDQSSEWSLSQHEESHWRNLLIVRDAVNKAIEAARAHKYVAL
jgi:hypothetical protein